jgi:hypothetical protein
MKAPALRYHQKMSRRARRSLDHVIYAYKLRVRKQQRTALASYPRSGNTWLRYLLEQATGQRCGTIYEAERVMPGPDEGLAVKTHMLDSYRYSRAIHLVRNPFDVLDSYYSWKGDCAGAADMSWDLFVEKRSRDWVRHSRHWLNASCDVFRVRYEDLIEDPLARLGALTAWLGLEILPERLHAAVESSRFDNMRRKWAADGQAGFFRRGTVGDSLGRYTPDQLRRLTTRFAPVLSELGYHRLLESLGGARE